MLINIVFKNPNWPETDQLAIFKEQLNPRCSWVGGLNPGPPEEKSSYLNRSATLAALATQRGCEIRARRGRRSSSSLVGRHFHFIRACNAG